MPDSRLGPIILCGLLCAALAGCGKKHESESDEISRAADSLIDLPASARRTGEVRVASAELTPLADTLVLSGDIEASPLRVAHVSSRVGGPVQHVTAVVGDRVGRGQALA